MPAGRQSCVIAVQTQQRFVCRRNGTDQLDFLLYDGDFFVPIIRLDLLERDNLPLPNTWDEVLALAESPPARN